MARMSNYGSAELAVLLSHLSAPSASNPPGTSDAARAASPSEAMALYFVAARLVELQMELAARADGSDSTDLTVELNTTREVLEGTRRALLSALESAETAERGQDVVPGPPTLSVVDGGRARPKRARQDQ
jgi:hypothetical protein